MMGSKVLEGVIVDTLRKAGEATSAANVARLLVADPSQGFVMRVAHALARLKMAGRVVGIPGQRQRDPQRWSAAPPERKKRASVGPGAVNRR